MTIQSLKLQHFRNYDVRELTFTPSTTFIVGENARGKTNILEAIFLVSSGNSFRATRIEEMVQWGNEVGRVTAVIESKETESKPMDVEVLLTTGQVQGERTQKRKFLLDGAPRQKKTVVGLLNAVLFRPEDMDLIAGSPSARRRFLDTLLSQADREYRDSLDSYEKALTRRNALLDVLREGNTTRAAFTFWDQLMIKHGNIITDKRRDFMNFLMTVHEYPMKLRIEYDSSTISESRLHQYAVQEVAAGHTLVGPHKDDFTVHLENGTSKELSRFGSRGEQRMAVLWLKTGELSYIEAKKGERPILLLDDIFSELDDRHQGMVMDLENQQQTIMTSTSATLPKNIADHIEYIEL